MKSKLIIPLVFVALALGWQLRRVPVKEMATDVTSASAGPLLEKPVAKVTTLVAKSATTPSSQKYTNTKFTTKEELAILKAVVTDVGNTVDPEKRVAEFKTSGLDTKEHLESSLAIVSADYPETLTQVDTEARVLALHHLDLSSHLSPEACTTLLKDSISKFMAASDGKRGRPYLFDFHDVALTCTTLDPKGMVELQRNVQHPKVSAQLKLVLKTKGAI